ncbi:GntR family transcriptional regulator [Atlantibacter sp.]|uniref:GntR family transcriptional regulator n=1 Tax=Atlantibacter sp. TaxID=1903473 RepID=UPI0013EF6648|nr:GntR family transcriptional regulator [Atlantibacter sp.]
MAVETLLNPTQPVNQQIYRILRSDIVHCLIPPGTPLSEKEVSVRFDVSRQPVREAFIKLAENGLIQIRPQRGSYVNKISLSQVRNGCFVRQAIECAVVRRAAGMITTGQLYQLEQNLNQQRTAIERKQINDFFVLDDAFHEKLADIAQCQLAWDTIENIKATIDRVRYMSLDHVSPPDMLLEQHLSIFTALENHDADAVDLAMTRHLQEISESVQLIKQENSDWFSDEF